MVFNSIDFAIFLPIVFILYWFVFKPFGVKISNIFLILTSYVFYGWWNWKVVFLLFFVTMVTYLAGKGIDYYQQKEVGPQKPKWYRSRAFLFHLLAIVINIGLLSFFKYYNFFILSFTSLFTLFGKDFSLNTISILLPIGISFYVFQSLTYTIDIYQKKLAPTKDIISYFAFMSFFPPLLSGPIGRASLLIPQFQENKKFDYDFAISGCKQILWGLFLKICIADRLSLYVNTVYGNLEFHNGTTILLAAIFYSIQIYCDFSGYSLMAIGIAKLFGIRLLDNFNRPYLATTIVDFWRRWHISLSTWFRDYVYFPLGGSHVSEKRLYFNIFITFLVSGLWHGAAWTFVFWGGLNGIFQIVGKVKEKYQPKLKINNILNYGLDVLATFSLVTFAWIFFRLSNISDAFYAVGKVLTNCGIPYFEGGLFFHGFFPLIILMITEFLEEFFPGKIKFFNSEKQWLRYASFVALTLIIILFGVFDGSQFIYFQF